MLHQYLFAKMKTLLLINVAIFAVVVVFGRPTEAIRVTRTKAIERAEFWMSKHVRNTGALNYADDQSGRKFKTNPFGLVCMAWNVYQTLDFARMDSVSKPISKDALLPGDALCNCGKGKRETGYILLFDRWTDSTKTHYYAYELPVNSPVVHRVVPYPYFHTNATFQMVPYRYNEIGD